MSDDYTFEAWVYPKADGKVNVANIAETGGVPEPIDIGSMKLEMNKWSHISVVRNVNNVLRTYVNGNPYSNSIIVRKTKRGMYQIESGDGKVLTYPTEDSLTVALAKHRILNPEIEIIDER